MSHSKITQNRRVGLFFYMQKTPRLFHELLSFSKSDAGTLNELIDFGLRNKVLIKTNNKYMVYSGVTDEAKRAFFNHSPRRIIQENTTTKNHNRGLSHCLPRRIITIKLKKKSGRVSKSNRSATPIAPIGQLDSYDEAMLQESSRNIEVGHGRKRSLEWNDKVALDYYKEKRDVIKNKKARPDPTDRFALK